MSDSITCKVQVHGPKTQVNCEPDPAPAASTKKGRAPKPPSLPSGSVYGPPPPPSPGVTKLLKQAQAQSGAGKPFVKQPSGKLDLGHTALKCAGEIDALAMLALGASRGPVMGALAAFKVGIDLGKCFARENDAAKQGAEDARAVSECESQGGTPLGMVDRGDHKELTCAVSRSPKP
jgi:hypothetical protein